MTEQWPTTEEYRRLFDAAARVKALAPWTWMEEINIFGVQNPETNEIGMVSIMGTLGEHLAIAVYLGPYGLAGFQTMQQSGPGFDPSLLLEIPQIQASFENREDTLPEERDLIKQLGYRFRGQHAWPAFRSYRPGYLPFSVDSAEARFLAHALDQVLEMAPRFKQNPELFRRPDGNEHLVRVPVRQDGALTWHDEIMTLPAFAPRSVKLAMDVPLLEKLKRQQQSKMTIQADLILLPGSIQATKGDRPLLMYALLMVDAGSGLILAVEAMSAEPSLEAMWGEVPLRVVRTFAKHNLVPATVSVRSTLMRDLLQPVANELRFKLRTSRRLAMLEEAEESFTSFLRRR